MEKDCSKCPSFLVDQDDIVEYFGRQSGVPMCAEYGYILGVPKDDKAHNAFLRKHYAKECVSFGEQRVTIKNKHYKSVIGTSSSVGILANREKPSTCNSCLFCVKQNTVHTETGFPLPLCSATGDLIFSGVTAANKCELGFSGPPMSSMPSGFRLLSQYSDEWTILVMDSSNDGPEVLGPNEFLSTVGSDKEVTDEDRKLGIAGWRKVEDPEGEGHDVFLPIFDEDFFEDEEKRKIPREDDDTHPELYVDYSGLLYQFAVDSWELDETLCLVGAPGLGKTEFGRWVAYLMKVPFNRFSFTKASEVDDMIGKIKFDTSVGTYWTDGRITSAFKKLGITMLDELNLGPEECKEFLRPIMDNSKQLVLDQDSGQIAERHPMARMLVSINPAWDARNIGATEFADAEVNRMSFSYVGWPDALTERKIIKSNCKLIGYDIPDELVSKIIKIGADLKEASESGLLPGSWGIRQQIKVAKKTKYYGLERAYKQASLNYFDPNIASEILTLIGQH